jgi:hypothetical protein
MCILPYNGWQHSFAVEREERTKTILHHAAWPVRVDRPRSGLKESCCAVRWERRWSETIRTPKNRGNTEWLHTEYAVDR